MCNLKFRSLVRFYVDAMAVLLTVAALVALALLLPPPPETRGMPIWFGQFLQSAGCLLAAAGYLVAGIWLAIGIEWRREVKALERRPLYAYLEDKRRALGVSRAALAGVLGMKAFDLYTLAPDQEMFLIGCLRLAAFFGDDPMTVAQIAGWQEPAR